MGPTVENYGAPSNVYVRTRGHIMEPIVKPVSSLIPIDKQLLYLSE
jgi:hypothetical protein